MIVCLRVDERLIHGQVAMTWTKELKLNGLVVASDEAASNELQKMTLKMAVPEGIKCIIKSVEDVTTILDDPRSESMRLMVLVPMVKDAVTLCKRYKNIEMVNIGNAGKTTSGEKKILSKEVMLTADELIGMFSKTLCGNGNLLVNIGPKPTGEMPEEQEPDLLNWLKQ